MSKFYIEAIENTTITLSDANVNVSVNPTGSGTITGAGTYPKGSNVSLSATANNGYRFINWLLKGYTQLEYIESSGTQYIDSEIIGNNDYKFEMTYQLTDAEQSNRGMFGTITSSDTQRFEIYLTQSYGYKLQFGYGTSYRNALTEDTNKHTLVADGNKWYQDETLVHTFTEETFNWSSSFYLFNMNRPTMLNGSKYKLFSAKLYDDNGTLVRDFIPVIRHKDNQVGLLDLVNLKFYGNQGTGEFIGGNVVGE